ncbi:MAG: hypothetical protein JWO31_3805 [Phycisphaerales bacterium]|nr:hypothetical protein [Phycisphaerales bacterium]
MCRFLCRAAAFASTVALLATLALVALSRWRSDEWQLTRWDATSRTLTEGRLAIRRGGVVLHAESTNALPGEDATRVAATAGPTNQRVVHLTLSGSGERGPWLWRDRYRTTSTVGINSSGLTDAWTLQFRLVAVLLIVAILPLAWTFALLRAYMRVLQARGFPVIAPEAGSVSSASATVA